MLEICEICGIKRLSQTLFQPSHGKPLDGGSVKNLICQYAKKPGCINTADYSPEELKASDSWEKRDLKK